MSKQIQNFYKSTLSLDWSIGIGTFYVSTKPTISDGWLVISPNNSTIREIIKYTSTGTDSNGDYVVVSERGVGGTTEQTHTVGEPIRMNVTAEYWKYMGDAIDSIVAAGVPNADTTTFGGVQEATASQIDSGTQTGSTGAELFINPKLLNDAHNIPFVAPGNSGNLMSSNGNDWISESRFKKSTASTNYVILNTSEKSTDPGGTYTKVKEVMVYYNGTVKVIFDLKTNNPFWGAKAKIYVDGIAVGTERTTASSTYITVDAEDVSVSPYSLVQIYVGGVNATNYVQNMKIGYDLSGDIDYKIIS